ncbi:hypothetical protein B0H14DRAFT_2193208, partial [Mycena olivaceomarginata]
LILCNHDMLLLLLFTTSIKSGDVGMVLNILAHWMVMFRGTGSMPKYADALFELINNLRKWPPALRDAYLNNWLVNLTGKLNAFKEIDLLQEHQNFWAKVGPENHRIQIPHHGISHSSPNAVEDIAKLQGWLESNNLQTYVKERPGHDTILRVRDLRVAGAAYANTPGAFKNFRRETRKVTYKHSSPVPAETESEEEEEGGADEETEQQLDRIEEDDLMYDDEEFTIMAD